MGITLECKDDGPIFEIGSDEDPNDGTTSDWVDVNTEKFDAVLDSIADFLNDIFGGGESEDDPPPGGGEGEPPPGGGEGDPEPGGEEDPPPDEGGDPPPGGEGDPPPDGDGDASGGGSGDTAGQQGQLVIDSTGSSIVRFTVHRPLAVRNSKAVIMPGVYRAEAGTFRIPLKKAPRRVSSPVR